MLPCGLGLEKFKNTSRCTEQVGSDQTQNRVVGYGVGDDDERHPFLLCDALMRCAKISYLYILGSFTKWQNLFFRPLTNKYYSTS